MMDILNDFITEYAIGEVVQFQLTTRDWVLGRIIHIYPSHPFQPWLILHLGTNKVYQRGESMIKKYEYQIIEIPHLKALN